MRSIINHNTTFSVLSLAAAAAFLGSVRAFGTTTTTTTTTTGAFMSQQQQLHNNKRTFLTRHSMTATDIPAVSDADTTTASSKIVKFAKYEGLGNDFILIDDRQSETPSLTPEESSKLCNRNFGIGGDGVIFALKASSEDYDFKMRIYNSDGSEPEMCGNGIRCLAQFLKDLGESPPNSVYRIDTLAGPIVPVVNDDTGMITVDMGSPILDGPSVPCTLEPNADDNSIVDQTLKVNGKEFKVSAVSMGNPHAIIFLKDLENDIEFEKDGPAIESMVEAFPQKTNVEFVQVLSDTHLKMKVWERGAGPTLACGTGTCALVVAAIRAGYIPRPSGPEGSEESQVRVTLPGGDLYIEWRESNNRIYMTGPGTRVFSGTAEL